MLFIPITVLILILGLIFIQYNHHQFILNQQKIKNTILLSEELSAKIKEFDEMKKKVDLLVLRAGFKS